MDRMASAAWAKLLDGEFFGLALLILGRDIVTPFTPIALEPNKIPHYFFTSGTELQTVPAY
jgi:hypothetical protein